MKELPSERHLVENEVVFRNYNEQVQKSIDEFKKVAAQENQALPVNPDDIPLLFYCECSNKKCRKRIRLTPSAYTKAHASSGHFIVIPGHEVAKIEHIVGQGEGYTIVEKIVQLPLGTTELNPI